MAIELQRDGRKRSYRKRRRAELEEDTRRRITEAAVKLHGTLGPARTTVSAIADEAGVQRATVYRHFPDTESLFAACSGHWMAQNPLPDAERWAEIGDPELRLRRGLGELYSWYGRTEYMLERISRDATLVPEIAGPLRARLAYLTRTRDLLLKGRPERGRSRSRAAAAIGHATAFETWRSLVREQDLDDAEAVELMARTVAQAGGLGRRAR
jgi:AcrR family transcriptional regulator